MLPLLHSKDWSIIEILEFGRHIKIDNKKPKSCPKKVKQINGNIIERIDT